MIDRVVFFNSWHLGDLHSNKEYVRQAAQALEQAGVSVSYAMPHNPRALNLPIAVEDIHLTPHLLNNPHSHASSTTLFINTWIGHFLTMPEHNYAAQAGMWSYLFEMISWATDRKVNIELYDDLMRYASVVNTDFRPALRSNLNVMVCNDTPISGQAHNGDWSAAVSRLADLYADQDATFICTKAFETTAPNIVFTDDLTNRAELGCDLPEIATLSESCDVIVTNSSGPGTYVMTRKNFTRDVSIAAFVIGPGNTFWDGLPGVTARTSWHPVWDDNSVFEILRGVINEKIYSHSR